ncbi:MAG: (deoxy)nucleoside triphosphate pyrophosphohydrolase [Planctomycetes bacterium]|nr:(deoxy)nucleoside triphosphate pyrophosphohydrolase [Planctomycetota bacterium]
MTEFRHKTIGIAVVEHQGCYLVGVRPPGASLAGFTEFPGGKCEANEDPSAAAVRECFEETGLRVEVLELLTRRLYEYAYGSVDLHFYLCHPLETPAAEHDLQGFRWQDLSSLGSMKFPDANVPVLKLLEQRAQATT